MVTVVNKYKHLPTESDLYIGRGSPLGNLFSHVPSGLAQYRVSTREEAISRYDAWLQQNIDKPNVKNELSRAIEIHKRTGKLFLVCFCAPQKCHGDIIKGVIEKML